MAVPRFALKKIMSGVCLALSSFDVYSAMCAFPRSCGYRQVMVTSLGAGTHVFQLDRSLGEFVLKTRSIKMPKRGTTRRNRYPTFNCHRTFHKTLTLHSTRGA